ncbi:Major capsid protein [Dissostichus eleginoides]|uniref:Major capsid protein n=1 Tax=Dissostichus eleginoides TaxID=100907 RepID=A0AAD9BGM6_DISEL|nr:Major capsid protein [Dissostichus eleginoides]
MSSLASPLPDIRRAIITKTECTKQAKDNRHQLHEHSAAQKRLQSRSSFLDPTEVLETTPTDARTSEWQNQWNSLGSHTSQWMERGLTPDECLTTTNLWLSGKQ